MLLLRLGRRSTRSSLKAIIGSSGPSVNFAQHVDMALALTIGREKTKVWPLLRRLRLRLRLSPRLRLDLNLNLNLFIQRGAGEAKQQESDEGKRRREPQRSVGRHSGRKSNRLSI